jgi:hypothetical protein
MSVDDDPGEDANDDTIGEVVKDPEAKSGCGISETSKLFMLNKRLVLYESCWGDQLCTTEDSTCHPTCQTAIRNLDQLPAFSRASGQSAESQCACRVPGMSALGGRHWQIGRDERFRGDRHSNSSETLKLGKMWRMRNKGQRWWRSAQAWSGIGTSRWRSVGRKEPECGWWRGVSASLAGEEACA